MDGLFADRYRHEFLRQDRDRGESCYLSERVEILGSTEGYLEARVEGSHGQQYFVEVDPSDPADGMFCDCPRYGSGFNCKHIWAAILAWDQMDGAPARNNRRAKQPAWKKQLKDLRRAIVDLPPVRASVAEQVSDKKSCYWFAICLQDNVEASRLTIRLFLRQTKANGEWGKPQRRGISPRDMRSLTDQVDLEIFSLLQPAENYGSARFGYSFHGDSMFHVPAGLHSRVLGLLGKTDRFLWSLDNRRLDDAYPLEWDDGPPWSIVARLQKSSDGQAIELLPRLMRSGETRDLTDAVYSFDDGLVLFRNKIARLRPQDSPWIRGWLTAGPICIAEGQLDEFLSALVAMPHLPEITLDDELGVTTSRFSPRPKIVISRDGRYGVSLHANVMMKYGDQEISFEDERSAFWNADERSWHPRDAAAEELWIQQLAAFHPKEPSGFRDDSAGLLIAHDQLPTLVSQLTANGWEVIAHGKLARRASSFNIEVSSGTDWFDLDAAVDFGGVTASLPALLAAARQRQQYVKLDDGSHGILPEEWLERYARLAEVGTADGDTVRFAKSQALLLDAMLDERENATLDRDFTHYCKKLGSFSGIKPAKAPRGFHGQLRPYQEDGLGWFKFLRDFQFGGCLADDMGLGKTVQVLAMLQGRRTQRRSKSDPSRPSIAVVPKSLIFNWSDEAARFAPKLRVSNYTGTDRKQQLEELEGGSLLITTYGTLIRDIEKLREIPFEYVILDEAQAIKNRNSQSAKACRLLQSKHRLAMTGTPIENHLGELWSLFEFLNPGMLGDASAFKSLTSAQEGETDSIACLRQGLRPFILRRTKQQVLKELPEKVEQTLYCEMNPKQAKLYGELRDHYRAHLGKKVDELGIKRSKIHVLEALLRLRQAACDPRLIDGGQKAEGSKIELLLGQLEEVIQEGHKALVFSQFTSLLALVRAEMDERGWSYEYLDGKTRKRGERVKRFQNDESCKLFLISLKAGGHGLNLTAANYVYILDPWWNPAVEAQAIDRAHRIGQIRHVNAYRIICRDTVESKIVQLQQSKRELAEAIITANESLIASLSLEDLEILFG